MDVLQPLSFLKACAIKILPILSTTKNNVLSILSGGKLKKKC